VKEIAEFWSLKENIAGSDRDLRETNEGEDEPWWHRDWIPWAASDGDAQSIDVRDGAHWGRLGTSAHDGTGYFRDGWPSLAAYPCEVADALEFGGEVDGAGSHTCCPKVSSGGPCPGRRSSTEPR
jgi:hypothetical protein